MSGIPTAHNMSFVKKVNQNAVLNTLIEHSPISRADIARITGLNKATVSSLINDLVEEDLIIDVGSQKKGVGRTPNLLMFNKNAGLCIGAEIAYGEIHVIVTDLSTNIIWEEERRFEPNAQPVEVVNTISELIRKGLLNCPKTPRGLLGIGVGVPSLVLPNSKTIMGVHTLNWHDVPIGEWLEKEFNVPVYMDTKSNVSLIAEKGFGKAVDAKNALYLSVGIGIGGGLLIDGKPYKGSFGFAGHLGHFSIDPSGPPCNCGRRGCWELLASGLALKDRSIESVIAKADEGDAESISDLVRIGEYLGMGIANLIHVLNPELIIIGGRMAKAKNWILNPCIRYLKTNLRPKIIENVRVDISDLGSNISSLGGATLVIKNVLTLKE